MYHEADPTVKQVDTISSISSFNQFNMRRALVLLRRDPQIEKHVPCFNPHHEDKKGSCLIHEWCFWCFGIGCGAHGDPVEAIRVGKGFSTRQEAISYICEQERIPPTDDKKTEAERQAIDHKIANLEWFYAQSLLDPEPAYTHLKNRANRRQAAKKHGAGYIEPMSIAKFVAKYPEDKREEVEQELKDLGLVSPLATSYSRTVSSSLFRHHGRIVGLIGRTWRSVFDDRRPKYVYCRNTEPALPETLLNLDNVDGSKPAHLFEGLLDAVQAEDHGVTNVMALGGLALTKGKVRAIKRKGITTIILVFDRDPNESGQKGVIRTGELLFKAGINVKVIELPFRNGNQKQDADSYFCDGATLDDWETRDQSMIGSMYA